jgi:hypothetical protein
LGRVGRLKRFLAPQFRDRGHVVLGVACCWSDHDAQS